MLFTLYATGMRVSELVGIKLNNLDLNRGSVQIIWKGNKERLIPLSDIAIKYLKIYLSDYREILSKGRDQIFVYLSTHGKKMTRQSFWHRIKIYVKRAGIDKEIFPHTLRHAFATHMINNGADLRSVQLLLGHSDLSTTQIYTHVAQSKLKILHKKHHPRG